MFLLFILNKKKNQKIMFRLIFFLLIMSFSLFAFLFPFSTKAQNQPQNDQTVKFYVYPMKLEMPVAPGETLSKEIIIQNQLPTPLTLRTYTMDYEIRKDNTFEFFPSGYENYSCANWISLSDSQFTLGGNQGKKVTLTLTIPPKVEPKGHYAVIFFASSDKPQSRIGTLVLQYTPGEEKTAGQIKELNISKYFWSKPKFVFFGGTISVPWQMVFENKGNVHLNLKNRVEILNIIGKSVYVSDLQRITVLPNTERELKGVWENAPIFGVFKAISKATYADAEDDNHTASKIVTFYIIPVRTITVTLVAIILVILIIIVVDKLGKQEKSPSMSSDKTRKGQVPCPKCKKLVDKETTHCPYCGSKVKKPVKKIIRNQKK